MPSHRDRSASPWRHHGRPRDRDRDRDRNGLDDHREGEKKHKRQRETSPASNGEDLLDVKQLGVDEITEEDYLFVAANLPISPS
jgi:hypothetical protein